MTKSVMEREPERATDAAEAGAAADSAAAPPAAPSQPVVDDELQGILQLESSGKRKRGLRFWLLGGIAAVVVAVILARAYGAKSAGVQYKTAPVETGSLTVLVTATGSLQPTDEVDVGSELSGVVSDLYVDNNDPVKAGEILAKLDTTRLEAQAQQSRASVDTAKARVQDAQATLEESRLALERAKNLYDAQLVPKSNLDSAQAAFDRAQAGLASAGAQERQAEASLSTIETDLTKAVIRSPVEGTVLSRSVERGQTVAASFQAPVLFKIAQDLRRMELHVDVDEADVSRVQKGQHAKFSVDAYPDRSFPATIREVSYASKTVEGVVTYEAILEVDNEDLLLRPGMTATADITVETIEDALLVPNAALRFSPPENAAAQRGSGGLVSMLLPRRPFRGRPTGASGQKPGPRVWTLENGHPVPRRIKTGSSDGTHTVVTSGDLEPGTELLVDVLSGPRS
jgi:HlyD family secretion protein